MTFALLGPRGTITEGSNPCSFFFFLSQLMFVFPCSFTNTIDWCCAQISVCLRPLFSLPRLAAGIHSVEAMKARPAGRGCFGTRALNP